MPDLFSQPQPPWSIPDRVAGPGPNQEFSGDWFRPARHAAQPRSVRGM